MVKHRFKAMILINPVLYSTDFLSKLKFIKYHNLKVMTLFVLEKRCIHKDCFLA